MDRNEMLAALKAHARKYPRMQPQDAVKLLYQSEFAGGHIIKSREYAYARIADEYAATPHDAAKPLFEEIGSGIARVNLAAVDKNEYPLDTLTDDFVRSAALHKGSMDAFLEKLSLLREAFDEIGFTFTREDLDAYLTKYALEGYPMVSHSAIYREAYAPAYRVMLLSCVNGGESKENDEKMPHNRK